MSERIMRDQKEHLSQVFLKDKGLVNFLVERTSIGPSDVVIEIGPGTGIITDKLLTKAGGVIAVEKDTGLYKSLAEKYANNSRLTILNQDFLDFNLPEFDYKVFSNPPFSIESLAVRKLIDHPTNPPQDAYLIMREEVAERLAGVPRDGQFSVLHKPWFDLEMFYYFHRSDFQPKPQLKSAMLRFAKKDVPLVSAHDRELYEYIITTGFGGGGRLNQNIAPVLTGRQLSDLSHDLNFNPGDKPSDLSFEQWLGIFGFVLSERPNGIRRTRVTPR